MPVVFNGKKVAPAPIAEKSHFEEWEERKAAQKPEEPEEESGYTKDTMPRGTEVSTDRYALMLMRRRVVRNKATAQLYAFLKVWHPGWSRWDFQHMEGAPAAERPTPGLAAGGMIVPSSKP